MVATQCLLVEAAATGSGVHGCTGHTVYHLYDSGHEVGIPGMLMQPEINLKCH